MVSDNLPLNFQEAVLNVLLCGRESVPALIIRGCVDESLYDGEYRTIARKVYAYIDEYRKPPSVDTVKLLFETNINGNSDRDRVIRKILKQCMEMDVDADYVVNHVQLFIRKQKIIRSLFNAHEMLVKPGISTKEEIEKAEEIIQNILRERSRSETDAGYDLFADHWMEVFDPEDDEGFIPTGIRELDVKLNMPKKGNLYMIIGGSNAGKTWFLIHLGKMALKLGYNVLHISLEMPVRKQMRFRYFQSLFGISRNGSEFITCRFHKNDKQTLDSVQAYLLRAKFCVTDPDFMKKFSKTFDDWKGRLGRLKIYQFPTAKLSLSQLEAFLDRLETQENFKPDILLLDYLDLMSLDRNDLRMSLSSLVKNLRGMAMDRNIALVTPTQSNREGVRGEKVIGAHVAESWDKHADSDVVLTITKTDSEKRANTTRVFVDKSRHSEAGYTIIQSQCFHTGQFALQSMLVSKFDEDKYLEQVKKIASSL